MNAIDIQKILYLSPFPILVSQKNIIQGKSRNFNFRKLLNKILQYILIWKFIFAKTLKIILSNVSFNILSEI